MPVCKDCGKHFGDGAFIYHECKDKLQTAIDNYLDNPADLRNEIAELKRQLEEAKWQAAFDGKLLNRIESELIGVQYVGPYDAGIRAIKQQLAESQARESRLRNAIDAHVNPCGCFNGCEFCNGKTTLEKALALPHDDTALKEYRDVVIDSVIEKLLNIGALGDGCWYIEQIRKMKFVVESTAKGDLNVI